MKKSGLVFRPKVTMDRTMKKTEITATACNGKDKSMYAFYECAVPHPAFFRHVAPLHFEILRKNSKMVAFAI